MTEVTRLFRTLGCHQVPHWWRGQEGLEVGHGGGLMLGAGLMNEVHKPG